MFLVCLHPDKGDYELHEIPRIEKGIMQKNMHDVYIS